MPAFDDITQQLQARLPLPPLYPTQPWDKALTQRIETASASDLVGSHVQPTQSEMLDACRAGLLLWNDDLEASHSIAQHLENATGSFRHAIMHRREGDEGNSQYWWRRTGAHPAFGAIYEAAVTALQHESHPAARVFREGLEEAKTWLPSNFLAFCYAAQRGLCESEWLERIQVVEMATLLQWCRAQMR